MKKYQNASESKKEWWEKINYLELIKRSIRIIWAKRRKLIILTIFIILTGGQFITSPTNVSMTFPSSPASYQTDKEDFSSDDWREIVGRIESREVMKEKIRSFLLGGSLFILLGAVIFILTLIFLITFMLNSYFHVLFMDEIAPCKKKKLWLRVVLLRLIIWGISLVTITVLLFPSGFFAWQRAWIPIIFLLPSAIVLWIAINIILSYVRRFSFFYLTQTDISITSSLDISYSLFIKKWKETLLASVVNFGINILASATLLFISLLLLFILILIGLIVGGVLILLLGKEFILAVVIGVFLLLVLTPLIIAGIFLKALWEAFILVFWFLYFREIAGSREISEKARKFSKVFENGKVLELEKKKLK